MNIVEFLQANRIQYREHGQHHHTRLGWVQVDCPWCGGAPGSFHMGLAVSRPVASCWRCGSRSISQTMRMLASGASFADVKYTHARQVKRSGTYNPPPTIELTALHKGYLLHRGLDCDIIEQFWKVRACGAGAGNKAGRLFIPIMLQGDPVSFTTRAIHDNGLRYISAAETEEAVPHKDLLYGEEHCAQTVVVVEGPLDVWAGGPGFACTFGTAFTPSQLLRISRYPRKILCYDAGGDTAGAVAVEGLAAALAVMPGTTEIVRLQTGKDTAAADYEEILELRRFAFGSEVGCGRIRDI